MDATTNGPRQSGRPVANGEDHASEEHEGCGDEPDIDEKLRRLKGSQGNERPYTNGLSDQCGGEDEANGARVVPAFAEFLRT